MRKKGKWFEGDIFSLKIGADKSKRLVEKYGKGVMKPQALETKKEGEKVIQGCITSQFNQMNFGIKRGEV
jgi:hypothetical protein